MRVIEKVLRHATFINVHEHLHGAHERLGDVVMAAQVAYAESGAYPELLSIYHLLGDPALMIR